MSVIHHSAICTRDVEASLRFWRDGLGLSEIMDERFEGDWPTLLRAPSSSLRAIFLGDPDRPSAGILELVDLGTGPAPDPVPSAAGGGFLLLSLMTDLEAALDRLDALGLGGTPRRTTVSGVAMAVVIDPDGVQVELVDSGAEANLEQMTQSTPPAL